MNSSRAKSFALALAAVLPACASVPALAVALSLPGVPLPALPAPKPPSVEVHTPLPVTVHTPVGSVTPTSSPGLTVSVPSPTPSVPPVEVSTPPVGSPPPPVKVPTPPPVKIPTPPPVPGAAPPLLGSPTPGGGPTGARSGSPAASSPVNGVARVVGPTARPGSAARVTAASPSSSRGRHPKGAGGLQPQAGGGPVTKSTAPTGVALAATVPARRDAARAADPRSRSSSGGGPLDAIGRHIPFPVPVPDWSKPIILVLLLLALGLGLRSMLAGRRARRLERQREGLLQDIDALQAALVPEIPRQVEGLAVSVAYRPAEGPAAGGDFYDVFSPAPGKVAVILGDVAGHGHEALRHAALIRFTLRAYLQAGLEPRTALALAGRSLEQPIGENCATVAVGIYDRRGSRLTYTLAGHPAPILRGVAAPEPLTTCSSPPIGWSLPTGRRQSVVVLPPGSEVCFFSDGLIEARTDGGFVGRDGLREMLDELGAHTQARALLERVQARSQATSDDMAACILAPRTGVRPQRLHVEEFEAGPEEVQKGGARRFLEACAVPAPRVEQMIGLAESILSSSETVVLRVESSPRGLEVSAHAPSSAASAADGPTAALPGDAARPARRAVDGALADEGPALLR
jgi:hypothetical protein